MQANAEIIQFVKLAAEEDCTVVQMSISIGTHLVPTVTIHNKPLHPSHPLWHGLPVTITSLNDMSQLTSKIDSLCICPGNPENRFLELMPYTDVPSVNTRRSTPYSHYRERDFGQKVTNTDERMKGTMRSVACDLLISSVHGARCDGCRKACITLNSSLRRERLRTENTNPGLQKSHSQMSKIDLINKIGH